MPSVVVFRLLRGLLLAGALSAPSIAQDTVAPATAKAELESHLALIDSRLAEANEAYDYFDPARATLRMAFADAGVSQAVTDRVADTWANSGLAFDYTGMRKDIYGFPRDELVASLNFIEDSRALRSELDAINRGMSSWAIYERGFRALLSERVGLYVKGATAIQMIDAASAIACGGAQSCIAARAQAIKQGEALSAAADRALGANRDAIAKASDHFFTRLKSEGRKPCTEASIVFLPAELQLGKRADVFVPMRPDKCVFKSLTLTLLEQKGPVFHLDPVGRIEMKDRNIAGFALVEARIETEDGSVLARGRIPAVARPGDCTGMSIYHFGEPLVVGRKSGTFVRLTPEGCTPPESRLTVVGSPANLLWASRGFGDRSIDTYGRAPGTAHIDATWGPLTARSFDLSIVPEDGPECTELAMSYGYLRLPQGATLKADPASGVAPDLRLGPEPCKPPDAKRTFQSVDTGIVTVGPQSGVLFAGQKPGKTRIVLEWGVLSAETPIEVVAPPPCEEVSLSYDPPAVVPGEGALANALFFTRAFGSPLSRMCVAPEGDTRYESLNPKVALVNPATGTVRGLTEGIAVIKLTRGSLRTSGEVTVVAK